jgi:hypothetical protein
VAKLLPRLEDATVGKIVIGGEDIAPLTGRKLLELRRKMQPDLLDAIPGEPEAGPAPVPPRGAGFLRSTAVHYRAATIGFAR